MRGTAPRPCPVYLTQTLERTTQPRPVTATGIGANNSAAESKVDRSDQLDPRYPWLSQNPPPQQPQSSFSLPRLSVR